MLLWLNFSLTLRKCFCSERNITCSTLRVDNKSPKNLHTTSETKLEVLSNTAVVQINIYSNNLSFSHSGRGKLKVSSWTVFLEIPNEYFKKHTGVNLKWYKLIRIRSAFCHCKCRYILECWKSVHNRTNDSSLPSLM
jgi:hypothetical protein